MENLGGLRVLIDRIGLPPRLTLLVALSEKNHGPIDQPPAVGAAEIRSVLQYVDGANLLGALLAFVLAEIPDSALPASPVAPTSDEPDDGDEENDDGDEEDTAEGERETAPVWQEDGGEEVLTPQEKRARTLADKKAAAAV